MYRGLILRECGIRYSIQHCTRLLYLLYHDLWPSNSKLKSVLLPKVECLCGMVPCGLRFWDLGSRAYSVFEFF